MTLYCFFYMHWFWITAILYVNRSNGVMVTDGYTTLTSSSLLKEVVTAAAMNDQRSSTATAAATVPANQTTAFPSPPLKVKSQVSNPSPSKHKTLPKKHLSSSSSSLTPPPQNKTRNILNFSSNFSSDNSSSSSSNPRVKEPTVIDLNLVVNASSSSSSLADNQTLNLFDNVTSEIDQISNSSNLNLSSSEEIKEEEFVSSSSSSSSSDNLSAAGITGITLGCVSVVAIVIGISFFLYKNRGFNRPQVLNDRCSNLDSSGYIDDTSVRDNSEEMYSLDNDSFLNSLEAMTIQNYWTDTVKHTKL